MRLAHYILGPPSRDGNASLNLTLQLQDMIPLHFLAEGRKILHTGWLSFLINVTTL
jgi:hypothetical protein